MTKKYFEGVCSSGVSFELDAEGLLHDVVFKGGCDGNLKAIALLIEGRSAQEVINTLGGINCGRKSTSCADQFARVLSEYLPE